MRSSADYVTFPRTGLTVPMEVWLLAADLESRGCTFSVQGDRLSVRPLSRLTPADVAAVKRWRLHLRALLEPTPTVQ